MGELLKKYRNPILVAVLLLTMAASYFVNQSRLAQGAETVTLPVTTQQDGQATGALQTYRAKREETALSDIAALQALCDQDKLDQTTREDAAKQLQTLVDLREKQAALESALSTSGMGECVVTLSPGAVTIVTEKATLSSGESALILTLCKTHADVEPSGVRVITAGDAAEKAP